MTMRKPDDRKQMEEMLHTLYAAEPAPEFVARLEAALQTQARDRAAAAPVGRASGLAAWWRATSGGRRRLAAAALAVLLLLSVSLAVIGPTQVVAAIQQWIGYVPGVGFVDLERTRLLAEPVSVTREGVTVTVSRLSATPEETVLLLESRGLPERGVDRDSLPMPQLALPDGTTVVATESSLDYGRGRYTFPPLPAGVTRVTLRLPRLPLVPAGAAPEAWQVPLRLDPAGSASDSALVRPAYRPDAAVAMRDGITLRVLEVAHDVTGTAVRTAVTWNDPTWRHRHLDVGPRLPFLRDERGGLYQQAHDQTGSVAVALAVEESGPQSTAAPTRQEDTSTFTPVDPAARELTLVVDALDFEIPVDQRFTIDLGDDPQLGDYYPLDVTLEIGGVPVQLTGARLLTVEQPVAPDRTETEIQLVFDIPPVPETQGRLLTGINLAAFEAGFTGSSGGYTPAENQLRAALVLREGAPLPTGAIDVHVTDASLWLLGPWEVRWPVPGAE